MASYWLVNTCTSANIQYNQPVYVTTSLLHDTTQLEPHLFYSNDSNKNISESLQRGESWYHQNVLSHTFGSQEQTVGSQINK